MRMSDICTWVEHAICAVEVARGRENIGPGTARQTGCGLARSAAGTDNCDAVPDVAELSAEGAGGRAD